MATGKQVTVDETVTLLHRLTSGRGVDCHVFNAGSQDVDVGGSSVAFGAGFPLIKTNDVGSAFLVHLRAGEGLYAIADAGQVSTVSVLITGEE